MGIYDFIILISILVLVAILIPYFSKIAGYKNTQQLYYLWYYHLLFGIIYYIYVSNFGGDALGYWREINFSYFNFKGDFKGTAFLYTFNYVFVIVLRVSFFTGSMIYTFIGFLGIMFFYLSTVNLVKTNVKVYGIALFPSIFFLPNLHFWSSGVGKDTLVFFSIGLFLFSIMKPIMRSPGILLSLALAYTVRPHIAIFMLASFGIGFMFDNKLQPALKIILSLVLIFAAALIFNDVLEYLKLDEISTESIDEFSEKKVEELSRSNTGSSVDISSYPLILKMFTFLFRPLFFDASSIMALLASVENLVLLVLFSKVINIESLKLIKKAPYQIKGLFIFFLVGTLSFSLILGNMGIMMRMKNMLVPGMLISLFWILSKKKEILINRYNKYNKYLEDKKSADVSQHVS